jgi:hypothetical protein
MGAPTHHQRYSNADDHNDRDGRNVVGNVGRNFHGVTISTPQLAELAQFGSGFCHFVPCDVSPIKWLAHAQRRFERVVPTLGIFFRS